MSDFLATRQVPLALCVCAFLSYLLSLYSSEAFIALALIPTEVFVTNNHVWTFVTSSFIEGNIFRLLIDVVLIVLITSPKELKFDQQFGLYFSSNILASTILSFMWLMIRFFGSDSQSFMLESSYGLGGVVMLLAMYTRRLVGDRPVLPQIPLVTFHYLPTILITAVTVLRVLQIRMEGEDPHASAFTFIGMFPEALHPVVLPLSIATYNFFSMVGIFPKLELDRRGLQHHLRYHDAKHSSSASGSGGAGDVVAAGSGSTSPDSGPGGSGEDLIAERRRAKAIKLLDARMAELSNEPEGWEDLKEKA